jgi:hypothetical protein
MKFVTLLSCICVWQKHFRVVQVERVFGAGRSWIVIRMWTAWRADCWPWIALVIWVASRLAVAVPAWACCTTNKVLVIPPISITKVRAHPDQLFQNCPVCTPNVILMVSTGFISFHPFLGKGKAHIHVHKSDIVAPWYPDWYPLL